ncbi:MAG: PT domain-containing protein [Clostridia bacterium]|nr:PT domain-containing protein [Clostridia bacterium]
MKSRSSALLTLIVLTIMTVFLAGVIPVSAEGSEKTDNEVTVIYHQDFESFSASAGSGSEAVFSDAKGNKPDGFRDYIGDGEKSGAVISDGKIGGTKSLRLMRYDSGVANMRITGLSIASFPDGSVIGFSFTFRYKVLGNYGFSVILGGIPASPDVTDYGGGTRNIFSAGTDDETGKDVLYVTDPRGGSLVATDALRPDTDITVEAVFTKGGDEFSLLINGASAGTFKYIGALTDLTAIRFDCHDWAEENDYSRAQKGSSHVNEIYFDDITLTAESSGGTVDPEKGYYRFTDGNVFFLEDLETLPTVGEYEKPGPDSEIFTVSQDLPFLRSSTTPFVNKDSSVRTGEDEDFDGTALFAKDFLDMRFWMIPVVADFYSDVSVEFTLKVKELTGCFELCVTNSDDGTITGSENRLGSVIRLEPSPDGKVSILNAARRAVGSLDKDSTVTIGAAFFIDSQKYVVILNGEMLPGSLSYYPEDLAGVSALRFDLEGTGSEVVIDNISVATGILEEAENASETPESTEQPSATPEDSPSPEPEVTEAPEATDAPQGSSTEAPQEGGKDKKGCGGAVGGGLAVICALLSAVVILNKKRR